MPGLNGRRLPFVVCLYVFGYSGMDTGPVGCEIRGLGSLNRVSRSLSSWRRIVGKTLSCSHNLKWCREEAFPQTSLCRFGDDLVSNSMGDK
jgi:hypothetical protein